MPYSAWTYTHTTAPNLRYIVLRCDWLVIYWTFEEIGPANLPQLWTTNYSCLHPCTVVRTLAGKKVDAHFKPCPAKHSNPGCGTIMDIKIPEVSGHLLNWNAIAHTHQSQVRIPRRWKCILPFGPTDGPGNNPRHNQLSVIEHFTTIVSFTCRSPLLLPILRPQRNQRPWKARGTKDVNASSTGPGYHKQQSYEIL